MKAGLELPEHHESFSLPPRVRIGVWVAAVALLVVGLALVVRGLGWAEPLGAVLGVLGAGLVFALWRCATIEVTVGRLRVVLEAGPLRAAVPTGSVDGATVRPATGWRRWYAAREVVLESSLRPPLVVPTGEPQPLVAALRLDERTAPGARGRS